MQTDYENSRPLRKIGIFAAVLLIAIPQLVCAASPTADEMAEARRAKRVLRGALAQASSVAQRDPGKESPSGTGHFRGKTRRPGSHGADRTAQRPGPAGARGRRRS